MEKKYVLLIVLVLYIYVHSVPFKLGIENIPHGFAQQLKRQGITSVGLITNQTGTDQVGNRTIDILLEQGVPLTYIFTPEHGIYGTTAIEQEVIDTIDDKTKLPIISLYGKYTGKPFDPAIVEKIDLFIFDIQDVGMRHYTYISTLLELLKTAAQYNKKIIVFDRPNPLGARMEGPIVSSDLISFIAAAPIPLRHGMTIGELARYFNRYVLEKPVSLHVIRMQHYQRNNGLSLLLYGLSPNIQTIQACHGYSFLGLLAEIRPFDVAIQTDHAFQCLLLPDSLNFPQKKWHELARYLKRLNINSTFYCYFSQRKKQHYSGLRMHIIDINKVPSFYVFLEIVQFFNKNKVILAFSRDFDKAVGTSQVRILVDNKHKSIHSLLRNVQKEVRAFAIRAQTVYLYQPMPII